MLRDPERLLECSDDPELRGRVDAALVDLPLECREAWRKALRDTHWARPSAPPVAAAGVTSPDAIGRERFSGWRRSCAASTRSLKT